MAGSGDFVLLKTRFDHGDSIAGRYLFEATRFSKPLKINLNKSTPTGPILHLLRVLELFKTRLPTKVSELWFF